MIIHYFSRSSLPSHTANSVHVMKMCAAFASHNHTVRLYGRLGLQQSETLHTFYNVPESFEVTLTPMSTMKVIGNLLYGIRTFGVSLFASFSALNTGAMFYYGRDVFTLLLPALLGFPFAVEAHSPPETPRLAQVYKMLFAARGFRGLVVISQPLKSYYMQTYNLRDQDVLVAHDGADIAAEPNFSQPESSWPLKVVYAGSLYRGRGVGLILELATRCPNYPFIIAGGSQQQIEVLQNSGCPSNVEFKGFLKQQDVQILLGSADILLAPYGRSVAVEGDKGDTAAFMSPLKIFEYMSHGKAIIASDLPAIREICDGNDVCTLCEPGDADAWGRALEKLASEPALRLRKGQAAYALLKTRYSWQKRAKEILTFTCRSTNL